MSVKKPALGVNRLCGSGFQSIVNGAQDILLSGADVALTGGVENMSQAPFVVRNARFGTTLGSNYAFEDSLWTGLTDSYCKLPMALTAENLAEQFKIPRERVDEFSLRSQKNWERAQKDGAFKEEITPVKVKVKGKEVDFEVDEHPRPQTTLDGLAKLPSLFKKNGVVTAGTASVISLFSVKIFEVLFFNNGSRTRRESVMEPLLWFWPQKRLSRSTIYSLWHAWWPTLMSVVHRRLWELVRSLPLKMC